MIAELGPKNNYWLPILVKNHHVLRTGNKDSQTSNNNTILERKSTSESSRKTPGSILRRAVHTTVFLKRGFSAKKKLILRAKKNGSY